MVKTIDDIASRWPFLVARGRHTGYRTLLAPDFLTECRLHGQLSDKAHADVPARVHQTSVDSAEVGRLTLIYRTERLAPPDLEGATSEHRPVVDEHGRPLQMLYGIVTRWPPSAPADERDLAVARAAALISYRRFLTDEDGYDVDASTAFPLHTSLAQRGQTREPNPPSPPPPAPPPTPAPLTLPPSSSEPLPPRPRRGRDPGLSSLLTRHGRALTAAAAVTVVIVVLAVWLLRPSPSPVDVVATKLVPPRGTLVNCSQPVRFTLSATIRPREGGRVIYRWEPAKLIDPKLRNGRLNLSADKQLEIKVTATRAVTRDKLKNNFQLVVDGQKHILDYDLRCASQ